MNKVYTVLDQDAKQSGSLSLVICENFAELNGVMCFNSLEKNASYLNLPSPSSFGFQYFKNQLPVTEIYPVAVLNNLEINYKNRKTGLGRKAVRAFRVIAEEYKARLGLLRIGTTGTGDEDYEGALKWRIRFYESEGWRCFKTPPIRGLVLVWMYHLLPPLLPEERASKNYLLAIPLNEELI